MERTDRRPDREKVSGMERENGKSPIIAPQAQLFETAKDRVGPEALFKRVVNERHPDHVLSLYAQ